MGGLFLYLLSRPRTGIVYLKSASAKILKYAATLRLRV